MHQNKVNCLKLQATAELSEDEQRFRMALENSPVAMFEQDLDLRYTWIYNPRLGSSVNEVIGKSDFDIMDPASGARLSALKRGVIETGQAIREVV